MQRMCCVWEGPFFIAICNINGYHVYMKKPTVNLHIRLPAKLKQEAEKVLFALGLDTSSAIRLFYTQVALKQTLPFSLPVLRSVSPKTAKLIAEALEDDGALGPFDDAKSALKALYAAT